MRKNDEKLEKSNNNDQYLFSFTFLYRKIDILLEKMFGKT